MVNLNHITLAGHLSRDPDLRWTPNGTAVAVLALAVHFRYRRGDQWVEDVCDVDCTVFGRQAEVAAEYLTTGSPVLIEGRLRFRTWETQDGQTRAQHDVVTSSVQFLPRYPSRVALEVGDTFDDIPF